MTDLRLAIREFGYVPHAHSFTPAYHWPDAWGHRWDAMVRFPPVAWAEVAIESLIRFQLMAQGTSRIRDWRDRLSCRDECAEKYEHTTSKDHDDIDSRFRVRMEPVAEDLAANFSKHDLDLFDSPAPITREHGDSVVLRAL